MHKKMIVLFCVFLALLFAFAACKRHTKYGTFIVDQQGMEHIVMTDANGETVLDADGNLIEIVTDSRSKKPVALPTQNGTAAAKGSEYQTHPVTFPGVVEKAEAVEDGFCSVKLPEGWEQVGTGIILLQHMQTDARIQISTDVGGTVEGAVKQLTSQIETLAPEGGYTQTDVTIDGLPATCTRYEYSGTTVMSYLLMTENGKVCRINCTVETSKFDAADVESVVQEIHFK